MTNKLKALAADEHSGDVVVSFSSKWKDALVEGEIEVVFRKRIPVKFSPKRMVIYIGSPECELFGTADIVEASFVDKRKAMSLAEKGKISKAELENYIGNLSEVGVYKISNICQFNQPISMSELKDKYGFNPPQSFFSISKKGLELLSKEFYK